MQLAREEEPYWRLNSDLEKEFWAERADGDNSNCHSGAMVLSNSSHRGASFRRGLPFEVHTAGIADVVSQDRSRTI